MDKPKLPENYSAPVSIKPTRVLIREREERAMTDIDKLIEELEEAEEGSRELDVRIVLALDLLPEPSVSMSDWQHKGDGKFRRVLKSDQVWCDDWFAKPYTTSVDAALGLIPEGWVFQELWRFPDTGRFRCQVRKLNGGGFPTDLLERGAAPALAVCIASLKARREDNG